MRLSRSIACLVLPAAALAGRAAQIDAAPPTTAPTTLPSAVNPLPSGNDLTLETVIVTAEKREEPLQDTPESITAIGGKEIEDAQIVDLREAAYRAPNVLFSNFSAVRESFPFIRGIGSGENSPAVTTYYDGVPQLDFSTTNLELYDIDRIEFVRGPQGTLYGRNTLGGVINVYSRTPTNTFHADTDVTFGSYSLQDYRGAISGPIIKDKLFFSFSGGFSERVGYTVNDFNNNNLDSRNHLFGKLQLLWTPTDQLDIRLIINGERDRDGDFPLSDLGGLHRQPRVVDHDFQGGANRTVNQDALNISYHGDAVTVTSVSAFQNWRSGETTDLDETPFPLLTRFNNESEYNLIEEVHASNPTDKPIVLGPDAKLKWLAGLFAFRQDQAEFIGNGLSATAAAGEGVPEAFTSFTDASLTNYGVGVFGDTTLTLDEKIDLTAGVRYDYEHAHGDIKNTDSIPLPGQNTISGNEDFDQVSPRFEAGYHWTPGIFTYVSAAKGYKVGGFNPTPPPGEPDKNTFGPEKSWDYEIGAKTSWLNNRLILDADLFWIDWRHQQLDVPVTGEPSVFFTDNVGSSTSKGAELEATIRPLENWDVFGGVGYTNAQFHHFIQANGASASNNQLPFAPNLTWNVGTQYTLPLRPGLRAWARAEVLGVGRYFYDSSNAASQDDYVLTNFRVGIGADHWRLEGYIDNAFNTHYFPIAFPFETALAPSGYVGESGAPQTAGIRLGFSY